MCLTKGSVSDDNDLVTTDITTGFTVAGEYDILDVLPTGVITDQGSAIFSSYGCNVEVLGTAAGTSYGAYLGVSGQNSTFYIGTAGSVTATQSNPEFGCLGVYILGSFYLENHGQVIASGFGGAGVALDGVGAVVNYGSISGSNDGIGSYDNTSTDKFTIDNYGDISGAAYSLYGQAEIDVIVNSGVMNGNILMGAGAGGAINNAGTINGAVSAVKGAVITDSGVITGDVRVTNGIINLINTEITVSGGGDTVNFVSGPNDIVNLSGAAAWDNVVGSNGVVNLSNGLTGVVGGGDTINFATGTTDTASLWNTTNSWDSVYGSNGTVYLNDAISSIVGGGDTVYLNYGFDNIASLWNTGGAFDGVYGSNNTVYLSNAQANVIGGNDAIEFFYGAGDTASLFNTGGAADTITSNNGVGGTLFINNAQANVTGNGDTIDFTSSGSNSVTVAGSNETFVAQPISGADLITGYNSTDQFYLSASQFGTSWATFMANDVSGTTSTVITDPGNSSNHITMVGVAPSSLLQGNFHFS